MKIVAFFIYILFIFYYNDNVDKGELNKMKKFLAVQKTQKTISKFEKLSATTYTKALRHLIFLEKMFPGEFEIREINVK